MIGARRRVAILAGALGLALAPTAMAQPTPPVAPVTEPVPVQHVYVAIVTSAGTITLDLDKTHAPLTTANFLKYVDTKRYDGAVFYRSMHLDWDTQPNGLIQGGIRDATKLLPPVAHEPTSQTGILHKTGTISLARFTPGTGRSDFTILLGDISSLDADPNGASEDSRAGFAAFGHVVGGMDVVRKIWNLPRSPTAGEGVMKGQVLEPPVRIITARRVAAPPAP